MTSRTTEGHSRGVLGIDTSDGPEPSHDLLERARRGWVRFVASLEEGATSDER
ncbi:hypothetical protein EDD96_5020 [Streptomyces sp. Ag109_G2-6]|uniref:hypothetical protein n=1 Tax=Streptomyces TaxID=1883 RepID=UPI000F9202EC|nr:MULTISPECIES: hypothetical protein [Streptomyces]RPF41224.1 hypothetical protein EDD96_5020 [Streptomyces sp. Ag109_G2-6]